MTIIGQQKEVNLTVMAYHYYTWVLHVLIVGPDHLVYVWLNV